MEFATSLAADKSLSNSLDCENAFWDAAKKSLDAAQNPVNLKQLSGIKAL